MVRDNEIVETYLSVSPRKGSAAVSLLVVGTVFLLSIIYWGNSFGLAEYLIASGEDVLLKHQYWRLFTTILIHSDMSHFLSNATGLFLFGYLLYGYFGVWVYPAGSFIFGSIVNLASLWTYPPNTRLLGASGVVYLVAGFWLILFVFVERRYSISNRLLRSVGFALVMLLSSSFDPTISYRTHAIGFLIGIIFGTIYFFAPQGFLKARRDPGAGILKI